MPDQAEVAIGGQAVIEGVMMRGTERYAVAVRKPNNQVVVKIIPFKPLRERNRIFGLPLVRGTVTMIEMMILGMRALNFSADASLDESRLEEDITVIDGHIEPEPSERKEKKKQEISPMAMAGTMVVAFGLAIFLFVICPNLISEWIIKPFLHNDIMSTATSAFADGDIAAAGETAHRTVETQKPIFFNIVAGAIRIIFFVVYIALISLMKDIRRIFQYHGAEHKVVHNYEARNGVSVENARVFTTIHPRCGTSFLIIVLMIAILVFAFIPWALNYMYPAFKGMNFWVQKAILFPIHLLFMPLIAGISYELLKFLAKRPGSILNFLSKPGQWLQKLTTSEPDDSMLEIAIIALDHANMAPASATADT